MPSSTTTALIAVMILSGGATTAHTQSSELRLKAAVLSKLPAFTQWPGEALSGKSSIDICVARPAPFEAALHDLVAGESIDGRPLAVRELAAAQAADGCAVIFIGSTSSIDKAALIKHVHQRPVLTVGDSPDFLDAGGIIALRIVDGRVRFDISLPAAEASGIRLSSQLLKLALSVRGGG